MTGNVGGVQETSTQHSNLLTWSFSSITQTVCLKSTSEKKVFADYQLTLSLLMVFTPVMTMNQLPLLP